MALVKVNRKRGVQVTQVRQSTMMRILFLGIFLCGLLLGAFVIMMVLLLPRFNPTVAQAVPTAAPTPTLPADTVFAELDAKDQVLTNLYQRVSPSVVHITNRSQTLDPFQGVVPQEGTGSGFVFDDQGHIITNNHVVAGADQLDVLLANGTSLSAQIVGTDEYYDVAVIKINVSPAALTPLQLGDSSQLKVGQTVIAIGNPFGLDRTLTSGLISALGRTVQTSSNSVIGQAIQTDAAINPGNSGGPLLDTRGRVVGMNTAINSPSGGSVGIGFAVPINIVKRVASALISSGQVAAGGPAEKAGLQATSISRQRRGYTYSGGDIIVAIDGKATNTKNDLQLALEENHKPGDTVTVTVYRDGKNTDVKVVLGQQ